MKWLKRFIREYFGFSKTETNGFIVLLLLSVLFLSAPVIMRSQRSGETTLLESDVLTLDSLVEVIENNLEKNDVLIQSSEITYFLFDPNTAGLESFINLGVPVWLGQRIIKYREKGGQFRVKDDLSKIYGLEEDLFARLRPWVDLPENQRRTEKLNVDFEDKTEVSENLRYLNLLDSTQLRTIRGIGPVLSARIVKYRNMVGGYTSWSQLIEVYGLESEVIEVMKAKIMIAEDFVPVKINLNKATSDELTMHPYFSSRQARMAVDYRNQQGGITAAADLLALPLFDSAAVKKLSPYLEF